MSKIIKICLWATAFVPLILDRTIFAPTNGNFFLRTFLLLTSLLFLIQFFSVQKFRNQIIEKIKLIIKNPLTISIFIFVLMFVISTVFAVNKYGALWGNIDRVEGLVGIIYYFSFFIFSLLIFEKKDWLWFFKLSLFTSIILLFQEFFELFTGGGIGNFFTGNATFLAGYLLFSIFCAIIVFGGSKNKFWKYFSVGVFILSILGIFITTNRGTIAGLGFAFISILIYGILKGKDISYKKFNFRSISIILLCSFIIFSGVFIATRKSLIWQKVPGISRIAVIGSEDATTQTRLIMAKISLQAVNPAQNGVKKFLIGWGPENFSIAYGKYFNPKQFDYEKRWFGRGHNDFFDKLVTTGVLGLLAYLSIYFFFFRFVFRKKEFSLSNIGLLFFGVSIFGHLLFLFLQITTFIPFFAVLAFAVYLNNDFDKENNKNKQIPVLASNKGHLFTSIFFSILVSFLCFVFFKNDLPGYIQKMKYDSLRRESNVVTMSKEIDNIFTPFTTVQVKIREEFLSFISNNYDPKNEYIVKLYDTALFRAEEYVNRSPYDIPFLAILADVYNNQGSRNTNLEFLKKGEEHIKKLLIFAPNRQDFNYILALNWLYQKKYNESFDQFEKIFNGDSKYFLHNDSGGAEGVYIIFIKHFYATRDKDNFIRTAKRLKENNYASSDNLDKIMEYINKTNKWPNIIFN